MRVCRLIFLAAYAVCMLAFSMPGTYADNSTIPSWMFSSRERLLKEREELLADRSEASSRLTKLEQVRRQCDTLLNDSAINKAQHDALLSWRADATDHINTLRNWKDGVEGDLMANDSDLRYLEDRMKRWACLK